jgi:hypothetical protein
MAEAGRKGKPQKRKKPGRRGPLPALALCLAGALCCLGGLSAVDRRIRAVTINQSPPLWEVEEELDREGTSVWHLTILGRETTVDLAPLQEAGREISLILRTPPAPVRLLLALLGP